MRKGFLARLGAAALLTIGAAGAARADTAADWQAVADPIIAIFEGSDYGSVTRDFDCQGLSLGAKQHPFANGGVNELTEGMSDAELAAIVGATMPRHGAVFLQALRQARARNFTGARSATLRLQNVENRGCDGRRGKSLKAGVREEIRAFLLSEKILARQVARAKFRSDLGLLYATCWARHVAGANAPTFAQYLFFYDYIVQNGVGRLADIVNIVRQIEFGRQYGETPMKEIEKKFLYIAQWLETEWTIARRNSYWKDSAFNGRVLREEFAAGRLDADKIKLLLVKYFRANIGNNRYSLISMNRSVITVVGRGRVNATPRDIREMTAKAGAISLSVLPTEPCPKPVLGEY